MILFWGLVFIICIFWISFRQFNVQLRPFPLPPGPRGIPFIGFLSHFVRGKNYSTKLIDMKKNWGKISTVQMGSYRCVWINDAKLIREAWANPVFCGRPKIPGVISRTFGITGGIIFNDGPHFQEQRRFILKTLRNLGFNKSSMEDLITEEAQELIEELIKLGSIPVSTRHRFNMASVNALWKIVTGETLSKEKDFSDSEIKKLVETLDRNMKLSQGAKIGFFIPWLTKLCPKLIGWNSYLQDANDVFNFWKAYAAKRVANYDESCEHDNFIDVYIKEIRECSNMDSSFFGKTGEMSLAIVLQDLFIAGTETTATSLCWALLYLASFQNVQRKLYEEIVAVIGTQNRPSLADKSKLIFTEAFIQEVLRHGTLAPLGMIHRSIEDSIFHGYFIPKDTIIQANICAAHHDPEYWTNYNPVEFEPERFIISGSLAAEPEKCPGEGKKLRSKNDGFLAFSSGKRVCPGEGLARDELFLFITAIVQEFQVEMDPNELFPGLEPVIGVSAIPKPHKLVFRKR